VGDSGGIDPERAVPVALDAVEDPALPVLGDAERCLGVADVEEVAVHAHQGVGVHHVGDHVPGGDVAPRDQVEAEPEPGGGQVDPHELPAGHAAHAGEGELLEVHPGCDRVGDQGRPDVGDAERRRDRQGALAADAVRRLAIRRLGLRRRGPPVVLGVRRGNGQGRR
jgi:hypothetical protein